MKAIPLDVVYHDDRLIIVNKPAGLACQGGLGVRRHLLRELEAFSGQRVRLLHRIDKETSGIVCALCGALPRVDLGTLYAAFVTGEKRYRIIVRGRFMRRSFTQRAVQSQNNKLKPTQTTYTVLRSFASYSYVEARLDTGRHHQLRRELAALSHPILGDDKYGDFALNRKLSTQTGVQKLYLAADRVRWNKQAQCHPLFRGRTFRVPLPDFFKAFLSRYHINPE